MDWDKLLEDILGERAEVEMEEVLSSWLMSVSEIFYTGGSQCKRG